MAKATSYLGTVPKQAARLPAGLPKTVADATRRMSSGTPRPRRAATPRVGTSRASSGYRPGNGGGSGIPKVTSPMASTPKKTINRAKGGTVRRGRRLGRPRANGASRI